MEVNDLTRRIIGAAIAVHRELGPGKPESAYEGALAREFELTGMACRRQKPVPVVYRGIKLECGYRLDLLVERTVVIEVKSVESISPVHRAQVLTYLKLGGWKIALLVNFNVAVLKEGLQRLVMGLEERGGKALGTPESFSKSAAHEAEPVSFYQEENCGDVESETLATEVIASALEVHRELGPGLLPSAYMACLCHELSLRGIGYERGRPLPLSYKGISFGEMDRIKLLVGGGLLVNTLAVAAIQALHRAQLLSQLRQTGCRLGLLINFDTVALRRGIKRVVLSRSTS